MASLASAAYLAAALAVAATGCAHSPPPTAQPPAAAAPGAAPEDHDEDGTGGDGPAPAAQVSADGLYSCHPARGDVELSLRAGFTARDLAIAYIGLTCHNVVLPVELAGHTHREAFSGRLKPVEVEPRIRALLTDMGLALVREHGAVLIADASWLTPRPDLILVRRVSEGGDLATHPPGIGTLAADDGILHVSDRSILVTRAAADALLADPTSGRKARLVASIRNGQPDGVKLYAIRPGGMYARLGFANGDTVHTVNGSRLTGPERLQPAALLVHRRLEIELTRRGRPMTLVIEIAD
jgi:hypothetical protein